MSERTRIARELHDTLLQSFQGLLLRFQSVLKILPERPLEARQRLESALDQAAAAITEGRDAVQGLRSSAFETNDLANAITAIGKELTSDASALNSPVIDVEVEGAPRNLQPHRARRGIPHCGRGIAQRLPARAGAADHSGDPIRQAAVPSCVFAMTERALTSRLSRRAAAAGHFGLHGMRERAEIVRRATGSLEQARFRHGGRAEHSRRHCL